MSFFLRWAVFAALSTMPFDSIAQRLNATVLNEVFNLYADGQYDIVKSMLANEGFSIEKSTPNYSLNGVNHKGTFSVIRKTESPVLLKRQMGFTDDCTISFSTDENEMRQLAEINFEFLADGAIEAFGTWKVHWMNDFGPRENLPSEMCSHSFQCFGIGGDRKVLASDGAQGTTLQRCSLHMELNDEPWVTKTENVPREQLRGKISYVTFPRMKNTVKPPVKKPASQAKRRVN